MALFGRAWPWKFFIARSDAMRPAIFAGDVLVVRRTSAEGAEYDVGDVIAYQKPSDPHAQTRRASASTSSPHVRRICMKMHPSNGVTEYLVQCDAERVADEAAVRAGQVIGEVEARFANIGRVFEGNSNHSPRSLSRFAPAPNARRAAGVSSRGHGARAAESLSLREREAQHHASAPESAAD